MILENIKTIGIIAAMDTEIDGIKAVLTDVKISSISGVDFYYGKYNKLNVVAARCGIGKVFAAICTEAMIINYHPDCIINTGVGGSLRPDLKVLDVVIASKAVQHDMDTSAIGDPLGLISGINKIYFESDMELSQEIISLGEKENLSCKSGTIASGDVFVSTDSLRNKLVKEFNADVCEMEGGSIAHVAYVNKVPFAIIRAISDTADGMEYMTFVDIAAQNSIKLLISLLNKLS